MNEIFERVFDFTYIACVWGTAVFLTAVLGRYVPVLTPDAVEKFIAETTNELVCQLRQDWKKLVVVVVGAAYGYAFYMWKSTRIEVIIASFTFTIVAHSYFFIYIKAWFKQQIKQLNTDQNAE